MYKIYKVHIYKSFLKFERKIQLLKLAIQDQNTNNLKYLLDR